MMGPGAMRGHRVAREAAPAYDCWRPKAGQAVDGIAAGLQQLRDADFADCTDEELGEVLLAIEQARIKPRLGSGKVIDAETAGHSACRTAWRRVATSPSGQCDKDHGTPWSEVGETALFNGKPLCRPHNSPRGTRGG